MKMTYNKYGEIISAPPSVRKEEYLLVSTLDGHGWQQPDWKRWIPDQDEYQWGFDKTKICEIDGNYYIDCILPYGTLLVRYGPPSGRFTAPLGTPYEKLSLPWVEEECEYHEYKVIAKAISVKCVVRKGIVAPGFEFPGGGIQYRHNETIITCINRRLLKEVTDLNAIRNKK